MENSKYYYRPYTVYTYDKVDSTNSVAKRAITMMGERLDLSVHIAGEQTAGRGRNDRVWINTDNAIMMSIVRGTRFSTNKLPMLNLVAAAAVRNALEIVTCHKVDFSIKWPNDIVTTERLEKVCGILSEVVRVEDRNYAIIGIGVNLNAERIPDGLLQPATSVFLQYGKYLNIRETVGVILDEFTSQMKLAESKPTEFLKSFAKECISLGRHVKVANDLTVRYGVGEKLSPNGQLIVRFEDGEEDVVYAADVSVRNLTPIDDSLALKLLPKRKRRSNKGDHGKAAIIAGSGNMPGAALMCTKACIRSGAGLTKVLVPESIRASFALIPEAMLVCDDKKADELIDWADSILIGCGLGVNERTAKLLKKVLLSHKPCVIDADGLNTLSAEPKLMELLHENVVLTPHPAEMGRLCKLETEEVIKRFSPTAIEFASKHGCCVLLKSASSIIVSAAGTIRYNDSGNSGLAKGGSGDVLAGIIAAMMAQGTKPFDAASLGSYLLGISAEKAIDFLHNRFIEATDIVDIIGNELLIKEPNANTDAN